MPGSPQGAVLTTRTRGDTPLRLIAHATRWRPAHSEGPHVPPLSQHLAAVAAATKGFLPDDEGQALYDAACTTAPGVWLEVGTYCGKSTVHLGGAAPAVGAHLVTLDHHRG